MPIQQMKQALSLSASPTIIMFNNFNAQVMKTKQRIAFYGEKREERGGTGNDRDDENKRVLNEVAFELHWLL